MKKDELFEEKIPACVTRLDRPVRIEGQARVGFDLLRHAKGDNVITIDFEMPEGELPSALDIMNTGAPCQLEIEGHRFHNLFVKGLHVQRPGDPGQVLGLVCGGFELGDSREVEEMVFLIPDLAIGYDDRLSQDGRVGLLRSFWRIRMPGAMTLWDVRGRFLAQEVRRDPSADRFTTSIAVRVEALRDVAPHKIVRRFDEILRGLSLAAGQPRGWARIKGLRGEEPVWQAFRNPVNAARARGLRMLNSDMPGVLTPFISAYSEWLDVLPPDKGPAVNALVWGLLEATCHRVFPAPFLVLACALETFMSGYCEYETSSYLPRERRKELLPSFESWQEKHVIPHIRDEDAQEFRERTVSAFSQYLQRTLRARLTKMFACVEHPDKGEVIQLFVRRRNAAAHEGYEPEPGDWEIVRRMVGLGYGYLLNEIGYEGPRIPWADRNV